MNPKQDWVENAKKNAALEAVKHVGDDTVIGLGSGSTAAYAIEAIGNKIKHEKLHVQGVPTSIQAFTLAVKHKIPITTLEEHPTLDLTIDGADQIDPELNLIKGMGGALAREKTVASSSKKLIIIADETKKVNILGQNNHPVPIEVLEFATPLVMRRIRELHGKPTIRQATKKVGPTITDNGNIIIDAAFGPIHKPEQLQNQLKTLPGIIETGLFLQMTDLAYIGKPTGTTQLTKKTNHHAR